MTRLRYACWIGSLLPAMVAGCEVIDARAWSPPRPASERVQQAVEASGWRFRSEWSPLVEWPGYPRGADEPRTRWTHPAFPDRHYNSSGTSVANSELDDQLAGSLRNDFVGWNAAIVLAQRGRNEAAVIRLVRQIVASDLTYRPQGRQESQPVPRSLRAAAAEAWCLAMRNSAGDAESVYADAGRLLERKELPQEVRAELMRGIARGVAPRRIPGLAESLRPADASEKGAILRRSAIDACVLYAIHQQPESPVAWEVPGGEAVGWQAADPVDEGPFPDQIWQLQHDADPYVRARFAALLAVLKHPQALEALKNQLSDTEPHVVRSALVSLGLVGSAAARELLAKEADRDEERLSQAAVAGLAFHGTDSLEPLARHRSASVRREVALRLVSWPSEASLECLRPLLADPQIPVQEAAAQTLASWPEPLSTTGLLMAIAESPTVKTRRSAHRELERRRGVTAFPIDADPASRALAAARLAEGWGLPLPAAPAVASEADDRRWRTLRSTEIEERLALWLQARRTAGEAQAAEWFMQLGPADVPTVEALLSRIDPAQAEFLMRSVLPRLEPAYGLLARLDARHTLAERQEAARELRRLAEIRPWPRAVLTTLKQRLAVEPDPQVWRDVMSGLLRDQRAEAATISQLALHGAWPDVRTLGCEHIAHQGRPDQAPTLVPLFSDPSPAVRQAAVLAAGRCGNPVVLDGWTPPGSAEPLPGLRSLLAGSRGEERVLIAAAMSRLGDDAGQRELIRLLHDDSPALRMAAAVAMGESKQSRFIEPLIQSVWTESHSQARAVGLSSLKRLVPAEQRPVGLAQAPNPQHAAELWNSARTP